MTGRPWLSTAARQCRNALSRFAPQTAPASRLFSTTAPAGALRDMSASGSASRNANANANPSSRLTALDDDPVDVLRSWVSNSNSFSARNNSSMNRGMRASPSSSSSQEDIALAASSDTYVKQMPRRWRRGDVYAPRDLSPVEMRRWKKMTPPTVDVVDALGFNPVDNYRNFSLISEYITSAGRIEHSSRTGLRPVNQRKMAKAIRRAVGLGLHPSVHLHPQILLMRSRWFPNATLPSTGTPPGSRNFRAGF